MLISSKVWDTGQTSKSSQGVAPSALFRRKKKSTKNGVYMNHKIGNLRYF